MCDERGVRCVALWEGTLAAPQELPFGAREMPRDVEEFGRRVATLVPRVPLDAPERMPRLPDGVGEGGCGEVGVSGCGCGCGCRGVGDGGGVTEGGALELVERFVGGVGGVVARSGKACCECWEGMAAVERPRGAVCVVERFRELFGMGVLSPRYVYRALVTRMPEESPRRFCVYMELLLHDFHVFSANRAAPVASTKVLSM